VRNFSDQNWGLSHDYRHCGPGQLVGLILSDDAVLSDGWVFDQTVRIQPLSTGATRPSQLVTFEFESSRCPDGLEDPRALGRVKTVGGV